MLFPKQKMHVVTNYEEKSSNDGWLVLDLSKVDTEGVGRLYIDLDDVKDLQAHKDDQANVMQKMKDLLGG